MAATALLLEEDASNAGVLPFVGKPASLLAGTSNAPLQHTCTTPPAEDIHVDDNVHDGFGHLEQVWQLTGAAPPVLPASSLQRQLLSSAPRVPYRRRNREPKSVCHWGQRKLLLSEVEFLSGLCVGGQTAHVVYAGGAPGTHMTLLSVLFPRMRFTLVDPSPFAEGIELLPNVRLVSGFFDKDLAAKLRVMHAPRGEGSPAGSRSRSSSRAAEHSDPLPTYFISDVRTGDWSIMSPAEMEQAVAADMLSQREWVRQLAPDAAMLKFRLPWSGGDTTYLSGRVFLPLWAPATSTESRLLVTPSIAASQGGGGGGGREYADAQWDNARYMEHMCYFNTKTRVSSYEHVLAGSVRGLCSCYDCAGEVAVWCSYLAACGTQHIPGLPGCDTLAVTDPQCPACLAGTVRRLVGLAGHHCSPHGQRHLDTQPKHPAQRHVAWFKPKVFDIAAGEMRFVDGGGRAPQGGQKRGRQSDDADLN